MKIALGCDHRGLELKRIMKAYLDSRQIAHHDFGTHTGEVCDFPLYAEKVAKAICDGVFDRGILLGGIGSGMAMAANKFAGVRAVACSEPYSAILSRRQLNTNILALGARVVAGGLSVLILESWLNAEYETGRNQRSLDILTRIEQRNKL
jgi:ribose 5-phosphate isomerase B